MHAYNVLAIHFTHLICRGYKVGSKDEKFKDAVQLFKLIFCITVSTLLFIILGVLIAFGMTVFFIIYRS
jgi:hypothetical protein